MDPMGYFIDGRLWVVGWNKMIETGGLEQMSRGTWAYANVQFLFYPFLGLRVCICQQKCIHKYIYKYTYTSIVSSIPLKCPHVCRLLWHLGTMLAWQKKKFPSQKLKCEKQTAVWRKSSCRSAKANGPRLQAWGSMKDLPRDPWWWDPLPISGTHTIPILQGILIGMGVPLLGVPRISLGKFRFTL